MRKTGFIILIAFLSTRVVAQPPVINSIAPAVTYPGDQIVINGSGFSATSSQLQVWFGQVKGTIVASSELSITVTVPPSARHGAIEVINLSTRLSARSSVKFAPYFSGGSFDATTQLEKQYETIANSELFDLCSCDLNGDSRPELAATRIGNLETDIIVLENTSTIGSISFTRRDKSNTPSLNISAPTEKITCADLNGDGKPELIASRAGGTRNEVFVLPNTTAGPISFGTRISLLLDVGSFARFVKVRDVNNDGKPDVIVTNSFNNQVYIFVNQSTGGTISFNPTPVKITITGAGTTYGLDVTDLDNDGLADLIINPFQNSDLFILKNQSSSSIIFGPPIVITATGTLNEVVSGDVNSDGKLDLIVSNTGSDEIKVLLNTTTASISFGTPISLATSDEPWGVDLADINGDQNLDIIVANKNQAEVNIFLHSGSGTSPYVQGDRQNVISSNPTRNINVADLDGDAKPDIAFSSFNLSTNNKVEVLRNKSCYVPVILNASPLSLCDGQMFQLESIPGIGIASYDWKKGGVSIGAPSASTFDFTPYNSADAGDYTVTATSESGACVTTSPILTITTGTGSVPTNPVISSNSPVCSGEDIQLNTTTTGFTYQWSGPDGFTSNVQNPTITSATVANAGLYSLILTDGTCRSNEATELVEVANLASFAITSSLPGNTICQGSSVTLSVNAAGGHSYQWIKDGVDIGGQTGTTLIVTQEGVYKNRVQNNSLMCSVETNTIEVTVLAPPVASFAVSATACNGASVPFTDQSVVDSRATPVYAWTFGDTGTSNVASPTHTYSTAQVFNPSLTVSYSGVTACSSMTSKSVTVVDPIQPTIATTLSSICPGEQATLSVAGTFTSLTWSTSETGASIVISQPGDYSVNSVDANGCSGIDLITIASSPVPTLVVTADKTAVASGEPVQLEVTGADSYSWTPVETLNDPLISNPIATPDQTVTYTVDGTLTGGCTSQETITITVNNDPGSLNIPNVFSPNGDGINDMWVIPGIEAFTDCIIAIFDKNGKRVYEKRGYQNDWNGTYDGKEVPSGTYYYVIGCPDLEQVTGHLLIGR